MSKLFDFSSLAMIPSAYKDGKLYSVRPTDGSGDFTFSRGSNLAATRVDVNGLIEKGRENLLPYSNDLNGSDWFATRLFGKTNGHSGYDGSNDAWLVIPNSSNNTHYVNQVITSGNGVQTISVYAKAGGYDYFSIRDGSASDTYGRFDLATQTTSTDGSNAIESKMVSVGNDWYRCSLTLNRTAGGSNNLLFYVNNVYSNKPAYVGDEVSGVYFQDFQVEQGMVASDVISTTTTSVSAGILEDMPRLDYSGGASCPSLLLEPQRTNKITQSEYFQSGWVDNGNISYDFGYLAPDGTNSAYKITGNDNGYISFAGVLNNDTRSVYARTTSGTGTLQLLTYFGNTNNTFTITEEWQRFDISSVTTSTGEANFYLADFRGSSSLDEVILWGAQCEAGSYPTSYIPTYGSSQTRSLDNVNELTGVSDLIGQSEGTLFLDFVANDDDALQIIYQVRTTGSTNVGQIDFRIQSRLLRALGNDAGTTQFNISAGPAVAGTRYKCAVRYANNDVAFYVNGVLKGSDTNASFSSSALQQISFSENTGTFFPSASIKQALVFPTGLTNTELASLTTL